MRARFRQVIQTGLALIRLGRFHFLGGGVLLHVLGAMMAVYSGAPLNLRALLWGQIAISAAQLMTHYANDYFDLAADRANHTPTNWSGGSRVLVENSLRPKTALRIALFLAAISLTATLILSLTIRPGVYTFALLFTAQALAWGYSAPPFRLHSRGLGELTTAMTVTLLTPLTGYYLQAGSLALMPVLAVLPLGCLQFAMLLAIEFPDEAGDRQVNKRTLVVRLGAYRAAGLYAASLLLAYALLPLLVAAGLPTGAALSIAAVSPVAAFLLWRVHRGDCFHPARWNVPGFYSIVLLVASAAAELVAFMLLTGTK